MKEGLGFDESVVESLEEMLLEADVGAETAAALADAIRARTSPTRRTDAAELRVPSPGGDRAPHRRPAPSPADPRPAFRWKSSFSWA